jgi:glycosyltransferase involved in cell wall biosynthesis
MSTPETHSCAEPRRAHEPPEPARKVLFASAHSIIDPSSGASVATLDLLQGLASAGFESRAFCTLKLDLPCEASLEKVIGEWPEPFEIAPTLGGPYRGRVLRTRRQNVTITMLEVESTRHIGQRPEEIHAVLALFQKFLLGDPPDLMLTYGSDLVTVGMIDLARRRGIPVVFAIHNLNYQNGPPVSDVDYRIVPSEFARRHYRDKIGWDCYVLPNPVDWERVRVADRAELPNEAKTFGGSCGESSGRELEETSREPRAGVRGQVPTTRDPVPDQEASARRRFVTFVNPVPAKGVGPFVRIAQELGRRRPDIPLLVVESRGDRRNLSTLGLGRDAEVNVQLMSSTTDPRRFFALTRIMLIPSLCCETQSLVAIESMINGIPVIASDRGAIPDTLGACGFTLPLPERLTPACTDVPAAEEVQPWIETIIRLWDDPTLYQEQSTLARAEARRWHPDRLRPLHAEFFRSVHVSPKASHALASIIIPCCNQIEVTRLCVSALFRFTRSPWELIAIDNGSTDGTGLYLEEMRNAAQVPVTLINNARNLGYPAAINQGLRAANGAYLVMLNNDAVVTDGWLDQLIALASARLEATNGARDPVESLAPGGSRDAQPRRVIGLVGPMSNSAAPPQLVERAAYEGIDDMHAFARRWRDEHRGKWFIVPKLSGFCMLMTRAVYDSVGGLDERFGLGLFDDDDLAERARRAGFTLAVAHDLFIHHFGGRTFEGNGIDVKSLRDENARRFAAKWGLPEPPFRTVRLEPFATGGSHVAVRPGSPIADSVAAPAERSRVSLTMIVRNEENHLPRCLESVRGLFDEIAIVDTGSTDRTIEIARSFGARVFEFTWIDDFGAARNESLVRAKGDYAFWLDADEVVEPEQREKLERLLRGLLPARAHGDVCPPGCAAYVLKRASDPWTDGVSGHSLVDHLRLFPLRADVRWTYRVHEQIIPALRLATIPLVWTDITIRHTGYVDRAARARKLDRNARILKAELSERPDDAYILFKLGQTAVACNDWNGAIGYLERSKKGSAPFDSVPRQIYALIAHAHQMLGDLEAAVRTCSQGLESDPANAELWFRKGFVHRLRGEQADARACWRRMLSLRRPEQL